jgi:hypothetical protein
MTANDGKPEDAGGGLILPRYVSLCLVMTPLLGAVLVLGMLLYVKGPTLIHSVIRNGHGLLPSAEQELAAARNDHNAILRMAEVCIVSQNISDAYHKIADEPFVRIEPDEAHALSLYAIQNAVELPGYFDATLYLSNAIGKERTRLAGQAVIQNLVMEAFEWTIVASGLFTTVLIGVKALASPRSRDYLLLAVAAIALSSLSTAVATLNSFYTPRLEYERIERSLTSLQTLHRTLASGIAREKHACDGKGEWTSWRARHIRELTNSFITIMGTTAKPFLASEDDPDVGKPGEDGQKHGRGAPTTREMTNNATSTSIH